MEFNTLLVKNNVMVFKRKQLKNIPSKVVDAKQTYNLMILLVIAISMLNTGTVNSKQDQFEEMKK